VEDHPELPAKRVRFTGHFEHTLDDRGRVTLPAKLREKFGSTVVITRGVGKFLLGYTWPEWEMKLEELDSLSITNDDDFKFLRYICSYASEEEIDKQGRVLIQGYLRLYAGIRADVVIEAVNTRFMIWDKQDWLAQMPGLDASGPDLAKRMDQRGLKL
jgi:MraZ protein